MTKAYQKSKNGRRLNIIFQQWVIEQMLQNINEYRDGVRLVLNGKSRWLIPVFALGITDWPEGQSWCGIKQGATNSKSNCRVCKTQTEEFRYTERGPGQYRSAVELFNAYRYFKSA